MRQKLFAAAAALIAACLLSTGAYSQGAVANATGAPASSPLKKEIERAYRLKTQNHNAEALAAFTAVLKKDPKNRAALAELGYIHAGLKHYNSAVKYLSAASLQDPSNMRLHMDLGYAHQALKQSGSAEEQFRFVAANPGEFQAQAQEALGTLTVSPQREQGYAALRRGDKAAARTAFAAAVANNPRDAASVKQLGFLNLNDGNLTAAAANFEAVRALEPGDYFNVLQLGYTYDRLQQKDRAREAFNAALASTDTKIHGAAQEALRSSGGASAPETGSSL